VSTLGRLTLLWMIPINVFLVAWVWLGRIVFGVGGWFFLVFLFSVVPVVLLGLLLTTVLAYTQHGRPRSLTPLQAWSQLLTWVALFGFGAFCPDFGDTEDSHVSLLTQAFGHTDAMLDASYAITFAFAGLAVVAYLVLLGALVFGRRDEAATMEG
jgi:hypothetical protein